MKTINRSKIEVLRESYEQQVNTHEISFREYIELEAQSDHNFFRFLFNEEFEQDFDASLTEEQREEYERFLNKIQDYNIFYVEVEDEENTLVCRVEEKLETIKANTLTNNSEDTKVRLIVVYYDNALFLVERFNSTKVRLIAFRGTLIPRWVQSFNSTKVRLIVCFVLFLTRLLECFNSTKVRLIVLWHSHIPLSIFLF